MAIWYWWLSSLGVAAPFCLVHHYACELWSCPLIASWLAILLARVSCALGCTGMLIGQARYKIWHQKHLVRTQAQKKISLQKITTKTAPSPILEKRSHLWEAQASGENWRILLVMKTDCTRDLFTQGCHLYLKGELSVTTNSIHSVIQGSLLLIYHLLTKYPITTRSRTAF